MYGYNGKVSTTFAQEFYFCAEWVVCACIVTIIVSGGEYYSHLRQLVSSNH